MHPLDSKFSSILKCAYPRIADTYVRHTLNELTKACNACQEFSTPPFRFRTSLLPDQLVFNHDVIMNLMRLEDIPVLHIADSHTNFQNVNFLRCKTSECIWESFDKCWASVYVGYPNVLLLYHESACTSPAFLNLAL